jgi:erythronate-4-phosphate dehydrogenase
LGIKPNWNPENVPLANSGNYINVDCKNKLDEEFISEVVLSTYNVLEDDSVLRNSPETFEKQRGDYPIRREFENYNLILSNVNIDVIKKLTQLGFRIN